MFIQDEIDNLEKYMKFMQVPIKMIPFYPPPHYKSLWLQEKQDKQYWNEIAIEFLKKKHNADTMRRGFSIEMYSGGPSHEQYFIALILQAQIVIGPTKKMVVSCMVEDLVC